ncbi:hypothetical protein DFAR_2330026 [Desulfarculales bacterium]
MLAALARRGQNANLATLQGVLQMLLPTWQVEHLVLWGLKYGLLQRT